MDANRRPKADTVAKAACTLRRLYVIICTFPLCVQAAFHAFNPNQTDRIQIVYRPHHHSCAGAAGGRYRAERLRQIERD